ncbi:MAG: hypothetical protein WD757_03385 [Actinomycetota bacterium]
MAVFPLAAAIIAVAFAALLVRQFRERRRPYQALWAIAMAMYAAASGALFLGVLDGWNPAEFRIYWLFGAVLNVPFLAQGEIYLLVRNRVVANAALTVLAVATGFAIFRVMSAPVTHEALARTLPKGREVFTSDPYAYKLAPFYAYPSYVFLVLGAALSARRMSGRSEHRNRFRGTLLIALGATVVAAGSAFAAAGAVFGFAATLAAGISLMFWGFVLASSKPGQAVSAE